LALPYLGHVSGIRGIRPPVTAVFENAAQTEEQQPRLDEPPMEARWRRKSLFGFGSSVDQEK
jgi:hypothetical protein